jgi:hypothetical protein
MEAVASRNAMNEHELLPKKRPLMGLMMADDFAEPITMGEKNITIREGWRDYHTGDKVLLGNVSGTWCRQAKITNVNFYTLRDVPPRDLEADGMPTVEDAINSLSAFYSNINEDSPVTVIKWVLE